jgi:hypothetical protein
MAELLGLFLTAAQIFDNRREEIGQDRGCFDRLKLYHYRISITLALPITALRQPRTVKSRLEPSGTANSRRWLPGSEATAQRRRRLATGRWS